MPDIVYPNTFTNGETADASQVDANFSAISNVVNGFIDATNLASGSVTSAKIAAGAVTPSLTEGLPYAQDLFAQGFVLSGLVASKDGTTASQLDVTSGVSYLVQSDGSVKRYAPSAATFATASASATYYLDFQPDGTWSFHTGHSTQTGYLTIATVTTDASSNIATVTDTRPYAGVVQLPEMASVPTAVGPTGTLIDVAGTLYISTGSAWTEVYVSPNPNLIPNPSFGQGNAFWTAVANGGVIQMDSVGSGSELFVASPTQTSTLIVTTSARIPVGPGATLTLSADMYTSGITAGGVNAQVQAYTSAGATVNTVYVAATNGQGWTRYSGTLTTGANTAYVQVILYYAGIAGSDLGWRRLKLEAGSVATTFTDDQGANPATLLGYSPLTQLIGCNVYAPATLATYFASSTSFTAIDTTNMTVSFTAPQSGRVLVRLTAMMWLSTTASPLVWGLLLHRTSTVVGATSMIGTGAASEQGPYSVVLPVSGLTPGTSYQYDWAFATKTSGDTAQTVAQGSSAAGSYSPAVMEVWSY